MLSRSSSRVHQLNPFFRTYGFPYECGIAIAPISNTIRLQKVIGTAALFYL